MEQAIRTIQQHPLRSLQKAAGWSIVSAGAIILLMQATQTVQPGLAHMLSDPEQRSVLNLSTIAGAATGLGGLAVLLMRKIDEEGLGFFMAISGGMMAAAALFSLFIPAVMAPGAAAYAIAAAIAGFGAMALMDAALPHEHPLEKAANANPMRAAMLMSVAIGLHNIPEGFAVGATPAAGAAGTAMSIGLQNIPEGMIVATALWAAGLNKWMAMGVALFTGLLESVGASLGIAVSESWEMGSPVAMGLAAGAMAFVVVHEIWPEAASRLTQAKAAILTASTAAATSVVLLMIS